MNANLDTIELGNGGQQKRQHRSRSDTRACDGPVGPVPPDASLVDCIDDISYSSSPICKQLFKRQFSINFAQIKQDGAHFNACAWYIRQVTSTHAISYSSHSRESTPYEFSRSSLSILFPLYNNITDLIRVIDTRKATIILFITTTDGGRRSVRSFYYSLTLSDFSSPHTVGAADV